MKLLLTLISIITVNIATVQATDTMEVRCSFSITKEGEPPYILNGVIQALTGSDYLTLEPTISSGAKFSARVLLTGDNYHPVTIHPRGDTAEYTAFGDLALDKSVELSHLDSAGTVYTLRCREN
jgi:hypothetical protein